MEKEQNKILSQVEDLKRQRDACHEKLGDIKTLTSFVMQAVRFWEEVGMLTNAATIKTEQLQILMDLAAEENTERILNSKGLQTKITSFKERWMEVAEMITSDRNNLTLNGSLITKTDMSLKHWRGTRSYSQGIIFQEAPPFL